MPHQFMKNKKQKMWKIPCDKCNFILEIRDENIDEISAGVWGTIPCSKCGNRLNPKIKEVYEK